MCLLDPLGCIFILHVGDMHSCKQPRRKEQPRPREIFQPGATPGSSLLVDGKHVWVLIASFYPTYSKCNLFRTESEFNNALCMLRSWPRSRGIPRPTIAQIPQHIKANNIPGFDQNFFCGHASPAERNSLALSILTEKVEGRMKRERYCKKCTKTPIKLK